MTTLLKWFRDNPLSIVTGGSLVALGLFLFDYADSRTVLTLAMVSLGLSIWAIIHARPSRLPIIFLASLLGVDAVQAEPGRVEATADQAEPGPAAESPLYARSNDLVDWAEFIVIDTEPGESLAIVDTSTDQQMFYAITRQTLEPIP